MAVLVTVALALALGAGARLLAAAAEKKLGCQGKAVAAIGEAGARGSCSSGWVTSLLAGQKAPPAAEEAAPGAQFPGHGQPSVEVLPGIHLVTPEQPDQNGIRPTELLVAQLRELAATETGSALLSALAEAQEESGKPLRIMAGRGAAQTVRSWSPSSFPFEGNWPAERVISAVMRATEISPDLLPPDLTGTGAPPRGEGSSPATVVIDPELQEHLVAKEHLDPATCPEQFPLIALFHELAHARGALRGEAIGPERRYLLDIHPEELAALLRLGVAGDLHKLKTRQYLLARDNAGISYEEARVIGIGPYADAPLTENALRRELGLPLRTRPNGGSSVCNVVCPRCANR